MSAIRFEKTYPNLPDRGKPFGTRRPAAARLPDTPRVRRGRAYACARPILPGQSRIHGEKLGVEHAAILVFLQPDALAARHLRHLGKREDQQLAVLADDRDVVARQRHAERALRRAP